MGILALKPVLRNIGNSQKNWQKTVEKLRQKEKWFENKFTWNILNLFLFSIKTPTYRKNAISNILSIFQGIDKNILRKFLFFVNFSVSFQ